MKRKHIAVLFFLGSLLAVSCSKMDALFNNGDPVTEYRSVGQPFHVVSMYNNVNVNLVQDSHPRLELICPENLIENITTEIKGDTLIIKNENGHNWLRSYDYSIDLIVYYDSLREVHYASIGELRNNDSIKGMGQLRIDSTGVEIDTIWSQSFILRINEGSGNIDLTFDCDVLKTVFNNGTSKATLHGYAGYTEHYMKSYGTIHAETLNSNIVSVSSESTNDIYVWARTKLVARIYSIGNVYYKGHPWIEKHIVGEGQIIKME